MEVIGLELASLWNNGMDAGTRGCIDYLEVGFMLRAQPFGDTQLHLIGRHYFTGWGFHEEECEPRFVSLEGVMCAQAAFFGVIGQELVVLAERLGDGSLPSELAFPLRRCA